MTTAPDWMGPVGDVWASEWQRTDRSFAPLSRHLDAAIAAAAPAGPFRALDIGCGAGGTSLALAAARPDARIIGADLSAGLLAVARQRAGDMEFGRVASPDAPLTFELGDATEIAAARAPLDLLYSRHGVMFFPDPVAAFTALHAAAAPGARLVFSCFRDWSLNTFATDLAAAIGGARPQPGPGPFAFESRDHVAAILSAAGWHDASAEPVDYLYRAGEGADPVADAVDFFRRIGPSAPVLRAASPDALPGLLAAVTAAIEQRRVGDVIDFPAAAWIWSATA